MLFLIRKLGQAIIVNGNTKITVVEATQTSKNGLAIKLSIEAPKEVVVDREEVHLRKQEDMKEVYEVLDSRDDS